MGRASPNTAAFYRSAHLLHQTFCDGHAQPRAVVGGAGVAVLLGERLVEVLLEFLAHANTGVGTDKLDPRGLAVAAHLAAGQVDGTVVLVVLDGVAQNVHQQPLQVQWAANECGVFDLGAVGHRDAALGGGALHRLADAVFQLYHVERAAFQQDLAGFGLPISALRSGSSSRVEASQILRRHSACLARSSL